MLSISVIYFISLGGAVLYGYMFSIDTRLWIASIHDIRIHPIQHSLCSHFMFYCNVWISADFTHAVQCYVTDIQVSCSSHYSDFKMSTVASQITSISTVCSAVCSKKIPMLRVIGLYEGIPPVTGGFPSSGPVTRKIFPFDDVIMYGNMVTVLHITMTS